MTRIDPYAATRSLVENAFSYLTWHEDACKAAGFKGISQVWKNEPAWYFWLDSVPGGFLLRLQDDEPLNDSQYVSLIAHFYPPPSEAENCRLSPEERRLLADSSVFDLPCQSALKIDPPPASNFDPPQRVNFDQNSWF